MSQDFTLDDFRRQLDQVEKMGMQNLLAQVPGMAALASQGNPEETLARIRRMIDAMTAEERADPDLLDEARQARVAAAAGTSPQEVAAFLAQFHKAQALMRQLAGMSIWQRLKFLSSGGKLPGADQEN